MIYRYYTKEEPFEYKQRVTIVGQYTKDGKLQLACARCSEKDQFIRKFGRELAEDRLNKGMFINTINAEKVEQDKRTEFFVTCAAQTAWVVLFDKEQVRRSKIKD